MQARRVINTSQYRFGNYEKILSSLLKYYPPENILIVQLEYLKDPDQLQFIMDRVQDHFGAKRRHVAPLQANNNQMNPKLVHLL